MPRETITLDQIDQAGAATYGAPKMSPEGIRVVIDWYTYQIMKGRGFQVRAGTVTTPLVGDVPITDATAEMCVDVATAVRTIMPTYLNVSVRLGTGTLHEYAAKSVATVSSAGDAFVPLALDSGGSDPVTTARVDAAGGVTVTAEVVTTTPRHWSYSNPLAIVTAGGGTQPGHNWEPRCPPKLKGPRCFYVQIAAAGTGPSYYAHFDYLELLSADLP